MLIYIQDKISKEGGLKLKNKQGSGELIAIILLICFVVLLAYPKIKNTQNSIKTLQNNMDNYIKKQMTNYHYNN